MDGYNLFWDQVFSFSNDPPTPSPARGRAPGRQAKTGQTQTRSPIPSVVPGPPRRSLSSYLVTEPRQKRDCRNDVLWPRPLTPYPTEPEAERGRVQVRGKSVRGERVHPDTIVPPRLPSLPTPDADVHLPTLSHTPPPTKGPAPPPRPGPAPPPRPTHHSTDLYTLVLGEKNCFTEDTGGRCPGGTVHPGPNQCGA